MQVANTWVTLALFNKTYELGTEDDNTLPLFVVMRSVSLADQTIARVKQLEYLARPDLPAPNLPSQEF